MTKIIMYFTFLFPLFLYSQERCKYIFKKHNNMNPYFKYTTDVLSPHYSEIFGDSVYAVGEIKTSIGKIYKVKRKPGMDWNSVGVSVDPQHNPSQYIQFWGSGAHNYKLYSSKDSPTAGVINIWSVETFINVLNKYRASSTPTPPTVHFYPTPKGITLETFVRRFVESRSKPLATSGTLFFHDMDVHSVEFLMPQKYLDPAVKFADLFINFYDYVKRENPKLEEMLNPKNDDLKSMETSPIYNVINQLDQIGYPISNSKLSVNTAKYYYDLAINSYDKHSKNKIDYNDFPEFIPKVMFFSKSPIEAIVLLLNTATESLNKTQRQKLLLTFGNYLTTLDKKELSSLSKQPKLPTTEDFFTELEKNKRNFQAFLRSTSI